MKDLSRKEAIKFLIEYPYLLGHMLGFKDLTLLHNDWIKSMILGEEDDTLQAHRGSFKTTCVSIALAEIMILFPNDKTMFMRKTDADVKEVIIQVKNILLSSIIQKICKNIYNKGLFLTTSSATAINTSLIKSVKGTPQLLGIGTKSSLTGKHFDRIFTDDIVNIEDRTSRAERERTKIIYQELQNIKNRGVGNRIFNTGTPWHKEDCFVLMPNPKKYTWKDTGLISEEQAKDIKSRMTNSLFAANYELRHIAEDDVIFADPITGADPSILNQARYCHVDAAYEGEDYTAFTIVKKTGGKYYVFGKIWRKHIDECETEIITWRQNFNAGKIWCETNGDKGYLAKDLKRRGERVVAYHEQMNKFLKITSYLKGVWKDVVFVEGTDTEYITQITDYNENAEHDDAPDSLASMIRELWGKRNEEDRYQPIIQ